MTGKNYEQEFDLEMKRAAVRAGIGCSAWLMMPLIPVH